MLALEVLALFFYFSLGIPTEAVVKKYLIKCCYVITSCIKELLRKNLIIVIRNGKIVWKHGPYCCYFHLNLKYLGWPYREFIKTAEDGWFCGKLLNENDFEAVLATFCCYDYGRSLQIKRSFRRSLQIKNVVTNVPRAL